MEAGPAPRTLPHFAVRLTADGALEVDKSKRSRKGKSPEFEECMATTPWIQQRFEQLRGTRVWRSVFRRGPARTTRAAWRYSATLHCTSCQSKCGEVAGRARNLLPGLNRFLSLCRSVPHRDPVDALYHPAVPDAYRDMKDLIYVVSNGVFLESHRLAAQAMVVAVFWHMFHVFYRGHKPPHEFNWVVGLGMLLVTLFLSYTGYLLPSDQLAFWAITVGTNIISYVPLGRPLGIAAGRAHHRTERLVDSMCCIASSCRSPPWHDCRAFRRVQKDGGLTVRDDHERDE